MKTTGFRSFVLYILLAAFLAGVIFLGANLLMHGDEWIAKPYNGHIYASGSAVAAGTLTDRNGEILAETIDGTRRYAEYENVRRSLLHTVGDSSGYISTAVQAVHRSQLMGYNFFTGLNHTFLSDLGMNDLQLTIDAGANAAAYSAMNGRKGAAFLYNYKTGEVLMKVSTPTYDPMAVPEDLLENEAYDGVFLDRTLSSTFAPGSIFKLVTAAAAMENLPDWQTRTYTCSGSTYLGDDYITCLAEHGTLDMTAAMGHSCNVYFAELAQDIGRETLQAQAESMGFGQSFSFDNCKTAASTLDLHTADANDLGWSAVGQGNVLANPYQMALLMGAIANHGTVPEPYVVQGKSTGTRYTLLDGTTARQLESIMRNTTAYYYGDGMFYGYTVCAKTGTAEVDGRNPNCWIVGFCQDESTPYAFAVCVENGESGLYTAGSVVQAALNALL